jgi:hypothetical protein
MATAAARSRLRITTDSNVELKCYARSRNLKKPRKRIVSEKEFHGKLPYNRHITLADPNHSSLWISLEFNGIT